MSDMANTFLRYVQPHWRRLYLVARQYATGEHDARDLVQETLLRAWKGFAPTEERTYRRAWLFVIMRNVAIEWQRSALRRINLVTISDAELTEMAAVDLTDSFSPLPAMSEASFGEFLDDRLAGALDKLEPVYREVIVLSVAGELTYREVAEALDCPVGTVMSRMARARRALRAHLVDPPKADQTRIERKGGGYEVQPRA